MSFIVQCLRVCPAAPWPHLPSLLITPHYGEVKLINQKALSQSLSYRKALPQNPHGQTGPRRVRVVLKDTAWPDC